MAYLSYTMRRVALLLLFWAAVVHFAVTLPPFEGSDEDKHFAYVTTLRDNGTFPDPRQSLQLATRQASGQAPLYYVAAWMWSTLAPDYTWDDGLRLNRYVNPVRPVVGWPDNANVFMFGPDQIPSESNPLLDEALMWQRWLSPLMGMLAVALAYASARLLLSRTWSLFAMLLFAFNPVLIFMFAYVTNDAAAILASSASTCCLMVILRRPVTPRPALVTGVVIGLGVLTKASVLVFAPIAMMVVLLRIIPVNQRGRVGTQRAVSLREYSHVNRWSLLLLLILPILIIGVPWYMWNAVQYGDPIGMLPHLRTFWALATPRSFGEALVWTLNDSAYQIRSMWCGIASGVVMSSHTVLIAPVLVLVLAVVGYLRAWRELYRRYRLVLLTLVLIWITIFTAYVRWLMQFDSVTGRLLLPGYPALVLLVTLALAHGWSESFMRSLRLVFGAAIVFGAVIVSGNITLPWFYTMFTMPPENVPVMSGEIAQFGDIQLMGYRIEPERLLSGVTPHATLCWRSLREDERLPVPYAFAFHITDADNTIYYGRDSYPGMGLYTHWQPGRAFCDRFTLEMREAVTPGHGYRIAIGLFNPGSLEPVHEDNGQTFFGWIAAPGPPLSEADHARYDFEGVYLLNYMLADEGDSLTVEASWGTGEWQARPLTIFIHVLDTNNTLVTQLDLPLGGDNYPSGLWDSHERTIDESYTLALPDNLPTGEYSVLFGLYDAERRLSVVDASGVAQADSVVRLGVIERE
jgi:uncharacterized membrane protein